MSAAESDGATAAATDQAKRFRESSDKVRERSDATAKGLAALGTTGLTAVGITKFTDVYPLPSGQEWVAVLVVGSFVVMTAMLAAFTFRLWNANRPLVPRSELSAMAVRDEIDDDELIEMNRVYDETAHRHDAASLRAYEARGERFQRIGDRAGDSALATALRAKAERIRAETDVAFTRAQLIVVRRRMNHALKGRRAIAFATVFVSALVCFGLGTDHIDSERSARLTAYKACADAVTAKVDRTILPKICDKAVEPKSSATPTAEQTSAASVSALATLLKTCVDTVVENKQPLNTCDEIRTQLDAAVGSAP